MSFFRLGVTYVSDMSIRILCRLALHVECNIIFHMEWSTYLYIKLNADVCPRQLLPHSILETPT